MVLVYVLMVDRRIERGTQEMESILFLLHLCSARLKEAVEKGEGGDVRRTRIHTYIEQNGSASRRAE
jgi:hypothetical protein